MILRLCAKMSFLQEYITQKARFGAFTTHYYILVSSNGEERSASLENLSKGARLLHVLKYPGCRKYYDLTPALIAFQRKVKRRGK
jgi:hypothetical protein